MKPPELKCKFIGFQVGGTAYVISWGGGKGTIPMNDYDIPVTPEEIEKAKGFNDLIKMKMPEIQKGANDSGFGVERIYKGRMYVYALFEYGVRVQIKVLTLDEKQLTEAKRGI